MSRACPQPGQSADAGEDTTVGSCETAQEVSELRTVPDTTVLQQR